MAATIIVTAIVAGLAIRDYYKRSASFRKSLRVCNKLKDAGKTHKGRSGRFKSLESKRNAIFSKSVTMALQGIPGSATYVGKPTQDTIDAVNAMAKLAFKKCKK